MAPEPRCHGPLALGGMALKEVKHHQHVMHLIFLTGQIRSEGNTNWKTLQVTMASLACAPTISPSSLHLTAEQVDVIIIIVIILVIIITIILIIIVVIIIPTISSLHLTAEQGREVSLHCLVESDPEAAVSWSFNNSLLTAGNVVEKIVGEGRVQSSLTLIRVDSR